MADVRHINLNGTLLEIPEMTGATASQVGNSGFVPAPGVNDREKFLKGDGTWAEAKQDISGKANISDIPTKTSDLVNDSGFLSSHQDISGKANIASPAFTGIPTAPTAAVSTENTQIATTAYVKAKVDSVLAANDAMVFKGTIGTGGTVTTLPNIHSAGWTYKVISAGSYAGFVCEIGDLIICIKDRDSANNADWTVVQTNVDGAVTGPVSSTDAHIAVFNGTSGKTVKDSGVTVESINRNIQALQNRIVFTTGSEPSNPVTGMIWLKQK